MQLLWRSWSYRDGFALIPAPDDMGLLADRAGREYLVSGSGERPVSVTRQEWYGSGKGINRALFS
jgi:hypothetical protein